MIYDGTQNPSALIAWCVMVCQTAVPLNILAVLLLISHGHQTIYKYAQQHGNDSGAQTNAERSRPRALPEALEALFARSRIVGVLLKHKAEDKLHRRINCFTAVTSAERYVYVDICTSKLYIETSI